MNQQLRVATLLLMMLVIGGGSLHAQITANFTYSPANGCAPQVVTFTNTSTGTITGYSWNFGNSASSVLQNPSTSYTTPGTYTVTLTVTGPSGTKTHSATVVIYPVPIVSFTFTPSSGCDPLPVSFTPTVTPGVTGSVSYVWDFGDGVNVTTPNPIHTYNYSPLQPFTPKVTVTNSKGCSSTLVSSNTVTVYPKPTVSFGGYPTNHCALPATVGFTSSIGGNGPFTTAWSFGDGGGVNNVANPSYAYTTAGTFTVKLSVTDAHNCKDSLTISNFITTKASSAAFTGPVSICAARAYGNPATFSPKATFTNTTPSATFAVTYWDYGDGKKDTGGVVSHAYTTPGTYTIRMATNVNGCMDTTVRVITVNPNPTVSFSYTPAVNCPAPVMFNFTGTGASAYQWSWSSGWTSTASNPTHTYTHDGFKDTLTLIGTNSFGCKDTINYASKLGQALVPVYDMGFSYLGVRHGCYPFTLYDTMQLVSSITPDGFYPGFPSVITSYNWDFGDGSSSTQRFPIHTYSLPGIYRHILTITTSNGCLVRDTTYIHVGGKVKPSFNFTPDTVCPHKLVYFTNTTTHPADSTFVYSWDVGDSYTLLYGRDATAFYFKPGSYKITLYADSNGCMDSTVCVNCLFVKPANANFTDTLVCPTSSKTVVFIDSSIGATSYRWNFGDGSTSTLSSPTHTYAAVGTYNVTLITNNSVYGCSDTMTVPVSVVTTQLSFSVTDTTLCLNDTLKLNLAYTGGANNISYKWTIDTKDSVESTTPGTSIFLMNPWDRMLNPQGLQTTPIVGYHTAKALVITYPGKGICIDTFQKNFIVSKPIPAFVANPLIACNPSQVTFTDSSKYTPGTGPGRLYWTFGDGDTAMNSNRTTTHYYDSTGFYSVKLRVTDWNGCSDSLTKLGYIEVRRPSAFFQIARPNACVNDTTNFTNLSAGSTGLITNWYFGDGDTSTAPFFAKHVYRAVGTYLVKVVVFDSTGCTDTMTKMVNVTHPTAAFTLSDSIAVCPPLIVHFASTSSAGTTGYFWDFNNSSSAIIKTPVSTFTAPGVYNIGLVVRDAAGCTDTARATVRVLGYAGAFSYSPLKGCAPLTVNFTSNVANAPSIVWDFRDGFTAPGIGLTTSHVYTNPGSYLPVLIFSGGAGSGCSASSIGIDTIKVDDVVAGFKVLPPCEKTPLQFIDTSRSFYSAIKDSRWDFGPFGIATGNPVNRTYSTAGTYAVTLISTNAQGCKDTVTRDITIYPLPKIVAMGDTAVCVPDAIPLLVSGGISYLWSPASYLSCTSCTQPIASPATPTNYVVIGTDSNGCMNRDTIRINIQTKNDIRYQRKRRNLPRSTLPAPCRRRNGV